MKTIVEDLVSARKARGWTQAQLAERTMLSRATVQKVETDKTDPHFSTLYEMSRAMGMELMVVPSALREELEMFVRAGGKWLGHPPGVSAPLSIVDEILNIEGNHKR